MSYDIYERPDLPQDAPLFIFIHGGYWQESNRDGNTFMVQPLIDAGCRVFLIGYDLCPTITLSELYDEIQVALTHILDICDKEYSSRRVVISGHSAGACLAISMLNQMRWQKLPNAHFITEVFLLGGIYDLSEARYTEVVNRDNLLGITDGNVSALSPLQQDYSHLQKVGVSVSVVIAEFEAPGLVEQGHQMFEKLTGDGVTTELVLAASLDHFDLVNELCDATSFLAQKMIGKCTSR